jgi:uncharacterized protein YaaW (UPF0174 family)
MMTSRLYELAALAIALVAVGAILSTSDVAPEARAAALGVIIGGILIVASMRRRDT